MNKTHVIDGKTYVEVDRKAKVGEKIFVVREELSINYKVGDLLTVSDVVEETIYNFGGVHVQEHEIFMYHSEYHVFERLESEECCVDTSQASPQVIEMFAALSRKIVSLESQLRDTQGNVERQAEETADVKHHAYQIELDVTDLERRLDNGKRPIEDTEDTVTLPRWVVEYLIGGASR